MTKFDRTIDWDDYWDSDLTVFDEQWKTEFAHDLADMLRELFDHAEDVHRVASVGCGPATTLLDLAASHSEVTFRGYDPSTTALEEARKRAADGGLDNVT